MRHGKIRSKKLAPELPNETASLGSTWRLITPTTPPPPPNSCPSITDAPKQRATGMHPHIPGGATTPHYPGITFTVNYLSTIPSLPIPEENKYVLLKQSF
jgi:hypothetical protein